MASVSSAVLCDFAQVREGLLTVVSGGITRLYRPELPAPMGVMLGVVVEVGYEEVDRVHELAIAVKVADTARAVGRLTGRLQASGILEPGESLYVPMAVDLRSVRVADYGAHDVQLSVGGGAGAMLTCYVKPPAGSSTG